MCLWFRSEVRHLSRSRVNMLCLSDPSWLALIHPFRCPASRCSPMERIQWLSRQYSQMLLPDSDLLSSWSEVDRSFDRLFSRAASIIRASVSISSSYGLQPFCIHSSVDACPSLEHSRGACVFPCHPNAHLFPYSISLRNPDTIISPASGCLASP